MKDRVDFFNSISGIDYPRMLVDFFDHFIALKSIVEDHGKISVDYVDDKIILFSIEFNTIYEKDEALSHIQSNTINVYGRTIFITIQNNLEKKLVIQLQ